MIPLEEAKDAKREERKRVLSEDTLGSNIRNAKYAIRGPVLKHARFLMEKKKLGESLKFDKFHRLNIGNPHILGQPPITFVREVIAASLCPKLIDSDSISKDARERASYYIKNVEKGALAAYSDGAGFPIFREAVKKYIEARDGHPCPIDTIFLMNGATDGIEALLTILIDQESDGVIDA